MERLLIPVWASAAFTPEKNANYTLQTPKTAVGSKFQVQYESQPFKPLFTKTDLFVVFYPESRKDKQHSFTSVYLPQ